MVWVDACSAAKTAMTCDRRDLSYVSMARRRMSDRVTPSLPAWASSLSANARGRDTLTVLRLITPPYALVHVVRRWCTRAPCKTSTHHHMHQFLLKLDR